MTDDELVMIRELFDADDHPLDEATAARLQDRLDAELAIAADEQGRERTTAPSRRRRRAVMVSSALVAAAAAVTVTLLLLPTTGSPNSGAPRSAAHRTTPPTTKSTTPSATKTPTFVVVGYTTSQATAVTTQCLNAANELGQKDAALRATFTDTLGSLLIVTTPTGFYTCQESPDGTFTGHPQFRSYQNIDGGPGNGDTDDRGAHWLLHPVELDSAGGGYQSSGVTAKTAAGVTPKTSVWATTAIGRVAPDVTKVVIQLPGRTPITATVENGFFVAQQVEAGAPPTPTQVTVPIFAYDAAGDPVYDSLTAPGAIPPGPAPGGQTPPVSIPCSVTPSSQPVTPNPSGEQCEVAVPWGY